MKILKQNAGLLTNSEAFQALVDRGSAGNMLNARSLASERIVHQYLENHSAGLLKQEQMAAFVSAVERFKLTRVEVLQCINLVPSSAVEVHLIVEECEKRLSEEDVDSLLAAVSDHLTPAQ